jgi:glyoxylase-like metal-dependent hydrolase (beta-lactamase superfamily II)
VFALGIALLTLAPGTPSPKAAEAEKVFCSYIDARDRHDFAAASRLTADDIRWLDTEGRNHPKNDARLKAMLAWEGGMSGRWTCRALSFSDGWLEVEISEQNRMYDALDVGTIFQRDRIRVEDGRIREGRTLAEWTTGREEDPAFDDFKKWLVTLPEDRRRGLLREGSLVYDVETAHRELPLLDEYEKAHPPARRLLADAVGAAGGAERLASLDAWVVEGHGRENLSGELQGISPDEPTWRPHEEKVAVLASPLRVAWQRHTPRNDQSLRWRRFIYELSSFGVVDFLAGYGVKRPRAISDEERLAMARRVPHVLLLEASTRAKRLVAAGPRAFDGATCDVIDATLSDGARVTLLLSRSPRALAGLEYAAYLPGLGDSVVDWSWYGWKNDPGVGLAPAGHRVTVNGTVFQEVAYDRYAASKADAAAMLEIPKDLAPPAGSAARVTAPAPAGPASGEVALGIHVAQIRGFTTSFFELPDSVVLFDAPASAPGLEAIPANGLAESERVTEELRAEIARACPGKPVRYVIVSHHHSDHLGGLRAFAGPGVTVFAAPMEARAARRALTAAHALAPDRWSGDGFDTNVEAVPDRRHLGDGARRIEIWNAGANPHTAENLFVWLPEERLLFQGDLFYYEQDAPFPPAGRETMDRFLAGWLTAHGLSPKGIYGVHYAGAAPPEALELSTR